MKRLFMLILILFLLGGCTSERFTVKGASAKYTIPFEWPTFQTQKEQNLAKHKGMIAKYKGIVYEGMPRYHLYDVFDRTLEKNYRKEGNEEWITFSNWTTEEPEDVVTFYLVNGKVKEWREKW